MKHAINTTVALYALYLFQYDHASFYFNMIMLPIQKIFIRF